MDSSIVRRLRGLVQVDSGDVRRLMIGLVLVGSATTTAWAVARGSGEETTMEATTAVGASVVETRWDLPVKRTDRVVYWELVLTGARREKMRLWLEQSGRYVPMIREELRARGMPEDLVYLALIESGFSPDAYSRARAVGLWQLMAGTGEDLGLKITPYVDQRRDPLAATDAALDFLKGLHDQFGSWWLAAAAYNCGPARVERVLRQVTGKTRGDDETYWLIASHLPKETQDYVPLMLAAGEIAKNPTAFGFDDLDYHAPLAFDSVRVPGGTRLTTVSRATGADSVVVDQLNPHYVRDVTPPGKEWTVRIPEGLRQAFVMNFPHLFSLQREEDAARAAAERERAAVARKAAPVKRKAHHVTRHHTTSRRHVARPSTSGHRSRR